MNALARQARRVFEETQEALAIVDRENRERYVAGLPPDKGDKRLLGLRQGVLANRFSFSGFKCKGCGAELVHGGEVNFSYPPTRWHECPGCGKRYCLPTYANPPRR